MKTRFTYRMMALQFALLLLLVCLPGLVVAQTAVSESFMLNSRSVTSDVDNTFSFEAEDCLAELNVNLVELPEISNVELLPIAETATEAVEVEETEHKGSHAVLSVKTNLLYDLLYTPQTGFKPAPNLSVEAYFGKRYSVQATIESPWWSNEEKQEYFQYQNLSIEPRFYLKGDRSFNGHFFGVYAQANLFDFALKGNNGSGVQGEGVGAGLSYGYVMPLGKKDSRWKLEFNVKVGFYETHYDPYDYDTNSSGERKYYYRYYGD